VIICPTLCLIQNTLILTFVVALALYGTFLGVEVAWADSVIEIIPMRLSPSTISFALAVVASHHIHIF
jgi:disulfide bond formation protein DsbB